MSLWKYFYPVSTPHIVRDPSSKLSESQGSSQEPTAKCFLILKPRLFDEQASVTDMTWSVRASPKAPQVAKRPNEWIDCIVSGVFISFTRSYNALSA